VGSVGGSETDDEAAVGEHRNGWIYLTVLDRRVHEEFVCAADWHSALPQEIPLPIVSPDAGYCSRRSTGSQRKFRKTASGRSARARPPASALRSADRARRWAPAACWRIACAHHRKKSLAVIEASVV